MIDLQELRDVLAGGNREVDVLLTRAGYAFLDADFLGEGKQLRRVHALELGQAGRRIGGNVEVLTRVLLLRVFALAIAIARGLAITLVGGHAVIARRAVVAVLETAPEALAPGQSLSTCAITSAVTPAVISAISALAVVAAGLGGSGSRSRTLSVLGMPCQGQFLARILVARGRSHRRARHVFGERAWASRGRDGSSS